MMAAKQLTWVCVHEAAYVSQLLPGMEEPSSLMSNIDDFCLKWVQQWDQ
jgi:hypothetical protein